MGFFTVAVQDNCIENKAVYRGGIKAIFTLEKAF